MVRLPVIVGFGGISPAGRSAFHLGYQRLVFDALSPDKQQETLQSLSGLMQVDPADKDFILDNTLIRKIGPTHFDVDNMPWNKRFPATARTDETISFITKIRALPEPLPDNWTVSVLDSRQCQVHIREHQDFLLPTSRKSPVSSAGQLPTGFAPDSLYQSKNHPRGIQMTVFGASDAIQSLGIDWDTIKSLVPADQISVYAGSGMSQLDTNGNGGMMFSRALGKKVTSKQCPFGFAEMPADFINAYLLGSLGTTGTNMGACASFLYNLRSGLMDIQSGRSKVALIGNAEAPVLPEIIDGYAAMGALITDEDLRSLDNKGGQAAIDFRRACRPFSTNKGFTLAESSQFIILMDDTLAMELGANIYGAISDVFINADGYKKSISAPGVGNYITVAKAMAAARSIVGEDALKSRSFIQAHGTGTPQNRVTESHILDTVAKEFGINNWMVGAVKSYLGHSIGCAAGDQIVTSLGIWDAGLFPGIKSIDHIADDVSHKHLHLPLDHLDIGCEAMDIGIINAKGFGGNNASATLLAPHLVHTLLENKHGKKVFSNYKKVNETVDQRADAYRMDTLNGKSEVIYQFNHKVCEAEDVSFSKAAITIDKAQAKIDLDIKSPYAQFNQQNAHD